MLNTSHKEVALLLVGYKRVDFLIDRLKEIKSNIPIPVYISVDGSDKLTEDEITKAVQNFISENRNMDITFKLQERNLGLAHHITTTISALLDKYPRLIVVEDDVVISSQFVKIMIAGLELSLADKTIGAVGGFSLFTSKNIFSRKVIFRKSKYFPSWGWAINKQNWGRFDLSLPKDFELKLVDSRTWSSFGSFRKSLWRSRFQKVTGANPPTWDYQMQYMLFKHDLKVLNTTQRISDNVGFSSFQSTNTVGRRPKWMGSLGVSNSGFHESISAASKIYSFFDSFTIGGDIRPFNWVSCFREFLKGFTKYFKD
jgi:hypothetical protein